MRAPSQLGDVMAAGEMRPLSGPIMLQQRTFWRLNAKGREWRDPAVQHPKFTLPIRLHSYGAIYIICTLYDNNILIVRLLYGQKD